MVDPNCLQSLHIVDLYYTHKIMVEDLKCHWLSSKIIIFKSFLSFYSVSKYLAIASALTNVDSRSDATYISALTTNSRSTMSMQWLVIVINSGKILDFNILYYALHIILGAGNKI